MWAVTPEKTGIQPKLFVRPQSVVPRTAKFAFVFAGSAPILFLFWLVFVGTFARWELLVGIGAALVGGIALCVVENAADSHFRPRARDLLQAIFVPWLLLQGTYELFWVTLRDLLGGRRAASAFKRRLPCTPLSCAPFSCSWGH